jgi:hypothetical protein
VVKNGSAGADSPEERTSTMLLTTPIAGAGAAAGPEAAGVAVRAALAGLEEPQVVIAFAADDLGPERAVAQAQAAAGEVPVVGLTSDVLLGAPGLVRGGCAALALGAPLRAGIGVATQASHDNRAAGRAAAAEALAGVGERAAHTLLLLLLDTVSGDQAETVAGAYEVAGGSVPLAGGAAAGRGPAQLAHGAAHTDTVVALAIGSPSPIGLGMAHGCSPLGVPSIVTAAEGTTVLELDGRPAAEVYLEKLGVAGAELTDEQFGDLAATHPLAQPELSGDVRLRHVLARERGGLRCATRIGVDAAVHFTAQTPEAMIDCTRDAVDGAVMALGGMPPRAALVFDCGGRKHVLGQALTSEADAVIAAFGPEPPPLAGLYTRGEIGRRRGAKGDRNHALVVVALG